MIWRYRGKPEVELSGNLAGKTLFQQVMTLALWPFIQNLMSTIVSFVDMMIAGRMKPEYIYEYEGHADVAGAMIEMMGPVVYVMWLMLILQAAVATGAQALVARANGAKDRVLAEKAFGQAMILGVVSGCVAGAIIWFLRDHIVSLSDISDRAKPFAENYIKIVSFSAPLSGALLVVNSCLRASGDTRRPFIAMLLVNVVNTIASVLLVYAPYPFGGYGEVGIAAGSVIGWLSGVVLILWIIRAKKENYTVDEPMILRGSYLKFQRELAWRIARISIPNAVEVVGMCAIHCVGFYFVAQLGKAYAEKIGVEAEGLIVGAHAVAVRIESFSFMPGFALGMAAATLAGQYLGAESPRIAVKAVRFCWGIGVLVMGTTGVIMYVFAEPLVRLLINTSDEQVQVAVGIIHIFAFAQPFFATALVMKMSMRGAGATVTVMVSSFLTMIFVRIVLLGWYTQSENSHIHGAWWIMCSDLLLQATVFSILHFSGRWTKKKV